MDIFVLKLWYIYYWGEEEKDHEGITDTHNTKMVPAYSPPPPFIPPVSQQYFGYCLLASKSSGIIVLFSLFLF